MMSVSIIQILALVALFFIFAYFWVSCWGCWQGPPWGQHGLRRRTRAAASHTHPPFHVAAAAAPRSRTPAAARRPAPQLYQLRPFMRRAKQESRRVAELL